ncbi:MAG: hypothetical protein CMA72_06810 [Euryarchaeota archaeon]|nr:hypothetical protein [Euryarchaeota archaeon]
MADDLGTQLGIQNEINKVLVAREAIMKRNASLLQGQAQLAKELCNALRCENLDGMDDRLRGINDAMEDAANAAQNAGNNFNSTTEEIGQMVDELDSASTSTKALTAASQGLKAVGSAFKVVGGSIMGAFSAAFNAVSAVAAGIGKAFSAILAASNEAAAAGRAVAEAFEDVRETFGDLSTGEGLAVTEAFHHVDKAANDFGVSLGSRFGPFAEGTVAKLKAMSAAMENLGSLGPLLEKQFTGKVVFAMDSLAKGAGISGEAFQSLANRSLNAGQSLEGVLEQTSKSIAAVARGIGVSTKTLGKSFDAIAKDVSNFGHLTVQEMTNLAAVMTKTGITMTTVQGVASKFDQFDSAAESVAKLTQAFGLNLNAIDLLNASDEERLQMLKTSFMQQGKSIDQLSRQERAYLASSAGIADSDLERVFGDQAGSIDETATAAERAQEAQITMAASMQEMEKSIKKIFGPLLSLTGLFSSFFEGFDKAFLLSGILSPLRQVLQEIFDLGFKSGTDFAAAIKSINENLGGLDGALGGLKKPFEILRDFFFEIKIAFQEGFEEDIFGNKTFNPGYLKTAFLNFFNRSITVIESVVTEVAPTIATAMGSVFGAAMQAVKNNPGAIASIQTGVSEALTFVFDQLTSFLTSGPGKALMMASAGAIAVSYGPMIIAMFAPLMAFAGPSIKTGLEAVGSISPATVGKAALAIGALALLASGSLFLFGQALGSMAGLTMQNVKVGAAVMLFALGSIGAIAVAAGIMGAVLSAPPIVFAVGVGAVAIAAFGVFLTKVLVPLAVQMVDGLKKIKPGAAKKASEVASDLTSAAASLAALGAVLAGTSVAGAASGVVSFLTGGKISPEDGMKKLVSVGMLAAKHMPRLDRAISKANVDADAISAFTRDTIRTGINISKFAGGIKEMSESLDIAKEALGSGNAGALAVATALVTDYNLVVDELRKLGHNGVDLDATIDTIQKGITTNKTKITIDRDKIELNVKLNVNLVADKLAEALSDRSVVSDEFRLVRSGGGVNV